MMARMLIMILIVYLLLYQIKEDGQPNVTKREIDADHDDH